MTTRVDTELPDELVDPVEQFVKEHNVTRRSSDSNAFTTRVAFVLAQRKIAELEESLEEARRTSQRIKELMKEAA